MMKLTIGGSCLAAAMVMIITTTAGYVNAFGDFELSQSYTGSASYYGDGGFDPPPIFPTAEGACSRKFTPSNPHYFAALAINTFQSWSNGQYPAAVCGHCIRVVAPGTGNTIVVPLVDACPGCAERSPYSLDLSHVALQDLLGPSRSAVAVGVLYDLTWSFTDCGDHGTFDYNTGASSSLPGPGGNVVVQAPAPPPVQAPAPSQQPMPVNCGNSYTVVSGDSCWAIATNHGISVDQFIGLNSGIECQNLQVGASVCVPGGAGAVQNPVPVQTTQQQQPQQPQPTPTPTPTQAPQQPPATGNTGCSSTYKIVSGDTCWALANKYGISLDQFLGLNSGIQCENLQIGAAVCIPGGAGNVQAPPPLTTQQQQPQPTQPP
ncbi:hypothetical protein HDU76_006085, partial [Blyttiomyces sp. JEL0837]